MKEKQIQTETSEAEHEGVQVGSIRSPPEGMHFVVHTHRTELSYEIMHGYRVKYRSIYMAIFF